jgi:GGDEF domain-containing protein
MRSATPKGAPHPHLDLPSATSPDSDSSMAAREKALARARFWSRLLLGAFLIVTAANLIWSIPGLRPGGTRSFYSNELGIQTLLAGGAALLAFAYIGMRDRMRGREVSLLAWTAVRDKLSHLRGHEYFFDRLSIECENAKRNGYGFAVFVLRLQAEDGVFPDLGRIHGTLSLLDPLSSGYDWLAAIGPSELAMLSPGTSEADAPAFASRLERLVVEALTEQENIKVLAGWAVYGEDRLTQPAQLLARARRSRNQLPGTGSRQPAA